MGGIPVWVIVVVVIAALIFIYWWRSERERDKRVKSIYAQAVAMMNGGKYDEAAKEFQRLQGYQDSAALAEKCRAAIPRQRYEKGVELMNKGDYSAALLYFDETGPDAASARMMIGKCQEHLNQQQYDQAVRWMEAGDYESARQAFERLKGFRDSKDKGFECARKLWEAKKAAEEAKQEADYAKGVRYFEAGDYNSAILCFRALPDGYEDKDDYILRIHAAQYEKGVECFEKGWTNKAKEFLESVPREYKDADSYMRRICAEKYGPDFCGDSPSYRHVWENLYHVVDLDSVLRQIGHGRNRCRYCGKEEDFSYDHDSEGS